MPRLKPDLLNNIALQSAREKLRLDAARARKAEADAPEREAVNQHGRRVVAYADQPALRDTDMEDINYEFERMACPHAAVAEYQAGFGSRWCKSKNLRDHWWFYNRGVSILAALSAASPDILEELSTPLINVSFLMEQLKMFIEMEHRASVEAARDRAISPRALEAVTAAELAEIEADIERRFEARLIARTEHLRHPSVQIEDINVTTPDHPYALLRGRSV